ncbi:hypothetical protein [Mycobacteroides abscessus]|uniref:hypothetical protein n=1 Tax=Mycobacteroides abscessus TaxID=36809 RepID=UPI001F367B7B|nr:hypothetical protein [Mycobacteroides abscessus]
MPGVSPVLAGIEDPGVLGAVLAVGSWEPLAALTPVAMLSAAAGSRSGSAMLGICGRPADLASWRCSGGCAAFPAGMVPDAEPCEELVLGGMELAEGPLPVTSPARVGFTPWGAADGAGAPGVLVDSALDEFTARGIGGSSWGATSGAWPVL